MMNKSLKYFVVDKSTTDDELKKQYRELSKKYHPDKEGGSEEFFTEMTNEYENILKSKFGKNKISIEDIRKRIYSELSDFYIKIAPELTQYKPEFLQLYDDLEKIGFRAIDDGISSLSKKMKIPQPLAMIFKKYAKATIRKESSKYRKKIEGL